MFLLSEKGALSRAEIEEYTGFKRTKVLEELKQLIDANKVEMIGSNRGTQYRLK